MKTPKITGRVVRATVLTLIATASVIGIVSLFRGYGEFKHELAVMHRVKLTDHRADVEYRLGSPGEVLGPIEKVTGPHSEVWGESRRVFEVDGPKGDQNTIPEGKTISDFDVWSYPGKDVGDLSVEFDKRGKVSELSCLSFADNPFACGLVAGLWITDPEEHVLRLGKPTRVVLDGTTKMMRYDDIGLEVWLTKAKVYSLQIRSPTGGEGAFLSRYLHSLLPAVDP
jgi:hypothetical protein